MRFVVKDFTERSFAQTKKSSVVSHNLEHVESADGSNWRRNNKEITEETKKEIEPDDKIDNDVRVKFDVDMNKEMDDLPIEIEMLNKENVDQKQKLQHQQQ